MSQSAQSPVTLSNTAPIAPSVRNLCRPTCRKKFCEQTKRPADRPLIHLPQLQYPTLKSQYCDVTVSEKIRNWNDIPPPATTFHRFVWLQHVGFNCWFRAVEMADTVSGKAYMYGRAIKMDDDSNELQSHCKYACVVFVQPATCVKRCLLGKRPAMATLSCSNQALSMS